MKLTSYVYVTLSCTSFPNSSSYFPYLSIIYLSIAWDSVNLNSPSIKYGKLGNSRPKVNLSPLNQEFAS